MTILKTAIRFLLCSLVFAFALGWYGKPFLEYLIPLFKWQIHMLDDQYQLIAFEIKNLGTDTVFSMQVNLAKPLLLAGQFIVPEDKGVATISSSTSHVWQMVAMYFALLFAWPVSKISAYATRLIISIPLLLILLMLDIPFALLANLWKLVLSQIAPDRFSLLILWNDLLESGGRLVLGLVGGCFVVWLERNIVVLKPNELN